MKTLRILLILSLLGGFAFASPTVAEFQVSAESEFEGCRVFIEPLHDNELVRFTFFLLSEFRPLEDGSTASLSVREGDKTISIASLAALSDETGERFVSFVLKTNFIEDSDFTIFLNPSAQDIRAYHVDLYSFFDSTK
jgi:hypothetical protein